MSPRTAEYVAKRRLCLTLAAAAALLLTAPLAAVAYHRRSLSIDTLTRRASVIVEATVASLSSAWDSSGTKIYTTITLQGARYHKGDLKRPRLELKLLGGTVGDVTMAVVGQPRFKPGEKVFLFLRPNFEVRDLPLVGMSEGKFVVRADPKTGVEHLESDVLRVSRQAALAEIEIILRPLTGTP